MSEVVIKIVHRGNGFCDVFVDGKLAGLLEDPEEYNVHQFLYHLFKLLVVENIRIEEKK